MEIVVYLVVGACSALLMFLTGAWFVTHHRSVVQGDHQSRLLLAEDTPQHIDYALSYYPMRWRTRRLLKKRLAELIYEEQMAMMGIKYVDVRLETLVVRKPVR
jgi:hypothetical protein